MHKIHTSQINIFKDEKICFITPTVSDIGGAQVYIRNKVLFLKKNEWIVDVITTKKGKSGILELQVFNNSIPELAYSYYLFSKRKKTEITGKLSELIKDGDYDEIIIESTCIPESTWAETISERIGAKHLCFLLQEKNVVINKGLQQFFSFKHQRRELAGISQKSLSILFSPFNPIDPQNSYRLSASCNNVEADVDHPLLHKIDKTKYDYIVGTLSRMDKPFVVPAVQAFIEYASSYPEKRFLYLFMGGAPKNSNFENNIKEMVNNGASNVEMVITGFIYPVPTKLLELCDVFFTSSGSARPLYRSGVPCISIDGDDFKPIGIIGKTTNNSLFRGENEPPVCFGQLMDDVLIKKTFAKEPSNYRSDVPDYTKHFEFISLSSQTKEYYNMDSIKVETCSDYKLKWALSLFGPVIYSKLGFYKRKITKSTNSDR